jgi:hypothetical protein
MRKLRKSQPFPTIKPRRIKTFGEQILQEELLSGKRVQLPAANLQKIADLVKDGTPNVIQPSMIEDVDDVEPLLAGKDFGRIPSLLPPRADDPEDSDEDIDPDAERAAEADAERTLTRSMDAGRRAERLVDTLKDKARYIIKIKNLHNMRLGENRDIEYFDEQGWRIESGDRKQYLKRAGNTVFSRTAENVYEVAVLPHGILLSDIDVARRDAIGRVTDKILLA